MKRTFKFLGLTLTVEVFNHCGSFEHNVETVFLDLLSLTPVDHKHRESWEAETCLRVLNCEVWHVSLEGQEVVTVRPPEQENPGDTDGMPVGKGIK